MLKAFHKLIKCPENIIRDIMLLAPRHRSCEQVEGSCEICSSLCMLDRSTAGILICRWCSFYIIHRGGYTSHRAAQFKLNLPQFKLNLHACREQSREMMAIITILSPAILDHEYDVCDDVLCICQIKGLVKGYNIIIESSRHQIIQCDICTKVINDYKRNVYAKMLILREFIVKGLGISDCYYYIIKIIAKSFARDLEIYAEN